MPTGKFSMAEVRKCLAGHEYQWPRQSWQHEGCVANSVVANESVANAVPNVVANESNNPNSWRVEVWREGNRERYNARQRELMKRRRAKAKEKRDGQRIEKAD